VKQMLNDKICQPACNNAACNFDGWDCVHPT
jgi:hypothetical protein